LDAILRAAEDQHPDVAYWSVTLIGRLGPEAGEAAPRLARLLPGPIDRAVRQRAAWALGRIGPPARDALPALHEAASGDDPRLARLAQKAIERISD
jgi:HEAT repeat protein